MFKWLTNWLEARRIRKEIRAVATIQLREGSVLVFECDYMMPNRIVEALRASIETITGAKAMLLMDKMKLAGVVHQPNAQTRPGTIEWDSPKYKTELSPGWQGLAVANAVDLAAIQLAQLRDEYGDLAPQVAAAKAKGQS